MFNNWTLTQLLDAYGEAAVDDARIEETLEFRETANIVEREARKNLRKFCQNALDKTKEDPVAKFTKIELARAIADLTDGLHEHDIQDATALPLERCREIAVMGNLFNHVFWG